MNRVSFIGNVGNEPTTTVLESGTVVMNFDVCTSESYTDKQGQPAKKNEWHRIVAWNDCAKKIQQHLHKGNFVTIKAKAINREYDQIITHQLTKTKSIDITVKRRVTEYKAFEIVIL